MTPYAYAPHIPRERIAATGIEPIDSLADLFQQQYVSLHGPSMSDINRDIGFTQLALMPEGATVINTTGQNVLDDGALLNIAKDRADFCYFSTTRPDNLEALQTYAGAGQARRFIFACNGYPEG